MMPVLPRERLERGIRDLHQEAGGLIAIAVVRPVDAVDLLAAAILGDTEALLLLGAINKLCDEIEAAPWKKPVLCVSCPRPLKGGGHSFAMALPERDDPRRLIGMGICPHCATTPKDITAKAVAHLRKIWPGLRPVTVTHRDGGRA